MNKQEWYSYKEVQDLLQKTNFKYFWISMFGTICGFILGLWVSK